MNTAPPIEERDIYRRANLGIWQPHHVSRVRFYLAARARNQQGGETYDLG
jgi:hypothetical protein